MLKQIDEKVEINLFVMLDIKYNLTKTVALLKTRRWIIDGKKVWKKFTIKKI